mgnify:CR=1 FL=1
MLYTGFECNEDCGSACHDLNFVAVLQFLRIYSRHAYKEEPQLAQITAFFH